MGPTLFTGGNLEWQRIIGTPGKREVGICVDEAEDGFLIGGGLWSEGGQKRYLSKLSMNGETLWEQRAWIESDETLRNFVLNEPRGGVFRHVNLLARLLDARHVVSLARGDL